MAACKHVCFTCVVAGLRECPDAGGKLPLAEAPKAGIYGLTEADRLKMDAFLRHPVWGAE